MYGQLIGIIIGILAGIIIIFLICRELVCWYWKINKIVSLMEEQNNLLKQHLGISPDLSSEKIVVNENIKAQNTFHEMGFETLKIINKTNLFEESNNDSKIICSLLVGEYVAILSKKVISGITWYNIKDKDNNEGWCCI